VEAKSELIEGALLLLVPFLLVNAPNCHLSLVLASVVQGDAVNCNGRESIFRLRFCSQFIESGSGFDIFEKLTPVQIPVTFHATKIQQCL